MNQKTPTHPSTYRKASGLLLRCATVSVAALGIAVFMVSVGNAYMNDDLISAAIRATVASGAVTVILVAGALICSTLSFRTYHTARAVVPAAPSKTAMMLRERAIRRESRFLGGR
jgi:hypothetical protein